MSTWCSNPGVEITGAIHRLQLPASQKDHSRTQTAAISDPLPDLRWVHRIKHPGCSWVGNGLSVGSEIPGGMEGEAGVSSYTDLFVRDRAEDNCAGRSAKTIYHYCLACGSQLSVAVYVTADLSAPIISNSNYRMTCTRTRQQEHCREQPH